MMKIICHSHGKGWTLCNWQIFVLRIIHRMKREICEGLLKFSDLHMSVVVELCPLNFEKI